MDTILYSILVIVRVLGISYFILKLKIGKIVSLKAPVINKI